MCHLAKFREDLSICQTAPEIWLFNGFYRATQLC